MSFAWLFAEALVATPVFTAAPLADTELAGLRGGIELPNGIDLALTVRTQTAVDGAVVLQTVFALVDGPPRVLVYAPPAGRTVAAGPAPLAGPGGVAIGPSVAFDAAHGVQVMPGMATIPVVVTSGRPATDGTIVGLERIDGASTATDAGVVDRAFAGELHTVSLTGTDFSVTHFLGGAFGSAIANSGSDRTISTATTVSIDLSNAGPEVLGSALLRADDIAADALATRF